MEQYLSDVRLGISDFLVKDIGCGDINKSVIPAELYLRENLSNIFWHLYGEFPNKHSLYGNIYIPHVTLYS